MKNVSVGWIVPMSFIYNGEGTLDLRIFEGVFSFKL